MSPYKLYKPATYHCLGSSYFCDCSKYLLLIFKIIISNNFLLMCRNAIKFYVMSLYLINWLKSVHNFNNNMCTLWVSLQIIIPINDSISLVPIFLYVISYCCVIACISHTILNFSGNRKFFVLLLIFSECFKILLTFCTFLVWQKFSFTHSQIRSSFFHE